MKFTFPVSLLLAVILEGVTILPLTGMVIVLTAPTATHNIFIWAALAGFVLDLFFVRSLGLSSIFFVVIISIIFLYKRKMDVANLFFIVTTVALVTFTYSSLFYKDYINSFYSSLMLVFLAGATLLFSRRFFRPK